MIDIYSYDMVPLSDFLAEYKELNANNRFRPVAVGRYGIRTRESIYSKELAQDYSKNKLIYKDTLTVGMGSVQMDIGILTDDITYSVSPAYHTYRINGINCDYLRFCLQARNADMFERYKKRGSRQGKSIDLKAWFHYLIPVYEIDGQLQIVSTLHKIQSIIDDRMQELQKLDDLVKARFVEMFGDPEHNNKHWREKSLFKLCKVGSSKRIYQNELCEQGVPFLKISDLVCKMDKGSCKYAFFIPEEKYDELVEQGLVPSPGDILVTARGTLGRCYIIAAEDRFYFQDGMITWLSDFDESICSQYIAHLFSMKGVKKQIEGLQAGSTVAYLSIAMTKNLKIMVPPIDLQKDFIAFVQQIDKSKFVESIHVLKLIKEAIAKEVSHDRIR